MSDIVTILEGEVPPWEVPTSRPELLRQGDEFAQWAVADEDFAVKNYYATMAVFCVLRANAG